jgi:hypothetical protein
MSKNTRQKAIEREGRIVLAINALKKGQIATIRQASHLYNVPLMTLHNHLNGCPGQTTTHANGLQLIKTKEESLKNWIILLALRGAAPWPSTI